MSCWYCNRPGVVSWDKDLVTCTHEMCKTLAFAEVRRRHHDGIRPEPERRLARALLDALDTLDYAVRLDERDELIESAEAMQIRDRERQQTVRLLAELRELSERYPPSRAIPPAPRPVRSPSLRYRRFVRRGRTVPLRTQLAA